jgi:pimeloyl-ACP methyl ester carboxylesterase
MSTPRHRVVEVRGLAIHCLEWGDPVGEPILLVHGFLDLAHSWCSFVDALRSHCQEDLWIVAPDCRGHGDSGWIGAGGYYHFPDYVFDLDAVVRALGVSRLRLVGHSMGGTIALLYAGAFPERIAKLVLIEGIGPTGMKFADAPDRMATWISEVNHRGRGHFRRYSSLTAGARQLRQTNPRLTDAAAMDLAIAAMRQDETGKWRWKFDPLHRTTAPQPFYTAQALEFLRRIQCAVLIVDGAQSSQPKRDDEQQRYNALGTREHIAIENAGHRVHQDNPVRLAECVADFFALPKVDCAGGIER